MAGSGAYVGREVAVEYSLNQSTTVIPSDFVVLGAMRAKSFGNEWDTIDVTADNSPGNTRQNLATYKTFNPSGSGISHGDDALNQDALELYVNAPTNGQPCGWIRITQTNRRINNENVYTAGYFQHVYTRCAV